MNIIEKADAIQKGVTNGPWTIETWADGRIFAINGRKGDPETYEYDTEVLEAEHGGECGCRSSCELTVTMSDADKHFVTESLNACGGDVRLRLAEAITVESGTRRERGNALVGISTL